MKNRLKELRESRLMSQTKLAKYLGVSQSALGYYERGERIMDIETARKAAFFFNTTVDYLIGASDNQYFSSKITEVDIVDEKACSLATKLLPLYRRAAKLDGYSDLEAIKKTDSLDLWIGSYVGKTDQYVINSIEKICNDLCLWQFIEMPDEKKELQCQEQQKTLEQSESGQTDDGKQE